MLILWSHTHWLIWLTLINMRDSRWKIVSKSHSICHYWTFTSTNPTLPASTVWLSCTRTNLIDCRCRQRLPLRQRIVTFLRNLNHLHCCFCASNKRKAHILFCVGDLFGTFSVWRMNILITVVNSELSETFLLLL